MTRHYFVVWRLPDGKTTQALVASAVNACRLCYEDKTPAKTSVVCAAFRSHVLW